MTSYQILFATVLVLWFTFLICKVVENIRRIREAENEPCDCVDCRLLARQRHRGLHGGHSEDYANQLVEAGFQQKTGE